MAEDFTRPAPNLPRHIQATMYLYDLVGGWEELTTERVLNVYEVIRASRFQGSRPTRFGFVDVGFLADSVIYGYFAQEYRRELLDYDEAKRPSTTPDEDFERFVFIMHLPGRRLALQRRRRSHPALPTWSVIFERFVDYLRLLLANAGLRPPSNVALEPLRVFWTPC